MAQVKWKCEDCKQTGTVVINMLREAEKITSAHFAKSPECPGKKLKVELG
jgi:flavin reductase (DIM6/NTAB) family NADH-FMN oxidoreductase RutF